MKKPIKNIIEEYTSNDQSEEIRNDFYTWLIDEEHKEEKDQELQHLWKNTPAAPSETTWLSLYRFKEKLFSKKKRKTIYIWQSIAALFILTSGFLLFMMLEGKHSVNTDLIEEFTPIAQVDSIYLPDGTLVYLNSKTTLLYPNEFTGKTRSVYLIGEATFNVKKNPAQPFIVKTSNLNITALGTEFNVEAYPEEPTITATLLSGSIAVDNLIDQTQVILTPEEQITFNRKSAVSKKDRIDKEIITAWQRGEISIQNKSIAEIIRVLERRFPVKFQYPHSVIHKEDKFNVRFRRDASLEEVMSVIQVVSGVSFTIDNEVCYLN